MPNLISKYKIIRTNGKLSAEFHGRGSSGLIRVDADLTPGNGAQAIVSVSDGQFSYCEQLAHTNGFKFHIIGTYEFREFLEAMSLLHTFLDMGLTHVESNGSSV